MVCDMERSGMVWDTATATKSYRTHTHTHTGTHACVCTRARARARTRTRTHTHTHTHGLQCTSSKRHSHDRGGVFQLISFWALTSQYGGRLWAEAAGEVSQTRVLSPAPLLPRPPTPPPPPSAECGRVSGS